MIKGKFFRKGESKLFSVVLVNENNRLIVFDDNNNQRLTSSMVTEASISNRVGNATRHITFPDESHFETQDNQAIDDILRNQKQPKSWIYWLESHYSTICAVLAITILLSWWTVQFGVPAVAKWGAYKLPVSLLEKSGQQTLAYMDKYVLEPSEISTSRQQELRSKFSASLLQTGTDIPIRIDFRKSDVLGANAFALPSGQIIFTDGLVNLSCDDRELLAILGHEVGHIESRHMMRRVIQSSFIALSTAIIIGDSSSMSELIIALPTFLLEMNYSRDFEREADDHALQFLYSHNIDPGYFSTIMDRIETKSMPTDKSDDEDEKVDSFFLTHPATSERVEKFGHTIKLSCDQ